MIRTLREFVPLATFVVPDTDRHRTAVVRPQNPTSGWSDVSLHPKSRLGKQEVFDVFGFIETEQDAARVQRQQFREERARTKGTAARFAFLEEYKIVFLWLVCGFIFHSDERSMNLNWQMKINTWMSKSVQPEGFAQESVGMINARVLAQTRTFCA